jgi:probable selenium-dependent hydroxylase accessory protein YqeC
MAQSAARRKLLTAYCLLFSPDSPCNWYEDALGQGTMNLTKALDVRPREMVSRIGAGGKTTSLFRLAKELRETGGKILLTTTTKMAKPARPHVDRLFLVEDADALLSATSQIPSPAIIGAGYKVDDDGQLLGLPLTWLDSLEQSGQFDSILIEADGAASRLLKVPSEIEPLVPSRCHLTIWVMAIKVLGKQLEPNWVHGAERTMPLLGVAAGVPVTKELIIRLVQDPLGCLKGIPPASRKVALLNQADSPEELEAAEDLGRALVRLGLGRVVVASYLGDQPVKEVIMS